MPFGVSNLDYLDKGRPLDVLIVGSNNKRLDILTSPAGTNTFTSLDLNRSAHQIASGLGAFSWTGGRYSPDGNYFATNSFGYPGILVYKRDSDNQWQQISTSNFDQLPVAPAVNSTSGVYACAWSPDGNYLAVICTSSPYLVIYYKSGDNFISSGITFDAVPNSTRSLAWSPDSSQLWIAHNSVPYINRYYRSGNVFANISGPSAWGGTVNNINFNKFGNIVAIAPSTATVANVIYTVSGNTVTPQTGYATIGASGISYGAKFNDIGDYIAFAYNQPPFLTIYANVNNAGWQKLPALTSPTATVTSIAWNGNANVYVGCQGSATNPGFSSYNRTGANTFVRTVPAVQAGAVQNLDFYSNTGNILISTSTTPGVSEYVVTNSGATFTLQDNWRRLTSQPIISYPAGLANIAVNYMIGVSSNVNGSIITSSTNSPPYVTLMKQDSQTSFTQLTLSTALPSTVFDSAITSDGLRVAYAHNTSPWAVVYNIYGNRAQVNPLAIPAVGTVNGRAIGWNSDQTALALGYSSSTSGWQAFTVSGNTFSTTGVTIDTITGITNCISWNPTDPNILARGIATSPGIYIHKRSGTTYTTISPSPVVASTILSLSWNPAGNILAATAQSGSVQLYDWDSGASTITARSSITTEFNQVFGSVWNSDGTQLFLMGYRAGGAMGGNNIVAATLDGTVSNVTYTTGSGNPPIAFTSGAGKYLGYYYQP